MPVGLTKVKRAEATLLGHFPGDLTTLETSELAECAWALATVLTAAQQGVRLAAEVFTLAESIAYSRNRLKFRDRGRVAAAGVTTRADDDQETRTHRPALHSAMLDELNAAGI
jgi:hypothetical protein